MTRQHFEQSLDELHTELIYMGSLVENSIAKSIDALKKQDVELAREVFKNDDVIDAMEQKIEKKCLSLIAMQQPLAKDLRSISTVLKIITDMERIGDHAADIAEITIRMANESYMKQLIKIPKMADKAKKMLKDSIDAYINSDIDLAKYVCNNDDEVDDLFRKIILELIELMKKDSNAIEQATNFMFIVKYLERIADHATNICEWVVFNVTGEHEHLATHFHKIEDMDTPFT